MNPKFPRSFFPAQLRTADAECGHKRHQSGVVREVIGFLELIARRDETGERFVWPRVDTIVEHCGRYQGAKYRKRAVESALKVLRRRGIISHRVKRWRLSAMRDGWIIAPHDAVFARKGKVCSFAGRGKTQMTGTAVWLRDGKKYVWSPDGPRNPKWMPPKGWAQ